MIRLGDLMHSYSITAKKYIGCTITAKKRPLSHTYLWYTWIYVYNTVQQFLQTLKFENHQPSYIEGRTKRKVSTKAWGIQISSP